MYALELLCSIIGVDPQKLSKEEKNIIAAELFIHVCDELKIMFKAQYQDYFCLMNFSTTMEEVMIEENFARCVIKDILSTEEYTLPGIAYYTQIPEDVVYDIAMGHNTNPSTILFHKIIKLHQSVRPALYRTIMKKIISKHHG